MSKSFENLFVSFVNVLDTYRDMNVSKLEECDFAEYKSKSYLYRRGLEELESCLHEYALEMAVLCDENMVKENPCFQHQNSIDSSGVL